MDVDLMLDQGIDLFNRGYYFEAHDVWEEIWQAEKGPMRNFFKGLIHLAGGLHHYQNENFRGSAALLRSGIDYLRPFSPGRLEVDLHSLLPIAEQQLAKVTRLRDGASEREDVVLFKVERST